MICVCENKDWVEKCSYMMGVIWIAWIQVMYTKTPTVVLIFSTADFKKKCEKMRYCNTVNKSNICFWKFSAAARAVAANYGWFIGMMLSGLVFIGVVVFIYYIHRKRKDIEEAPKRKPGCKYSLLWIYLKQQTFHS